MTSICISHNRGVPCFYFVVWDCATHVDNLCALPSDLEAVRWILSGSPDPTDGKSDAISVHKTLCHALDLYSFCRYGSLLPPCLPPPWWPSAASSGSAKLPVLPWPDWGSSWLLPLWGGGGPRSLASSGRPRRFVLASGLLSLGRRLPWPRDCWCVASWLPLNIVSKRFVAEAQVNIHFPDSSLCRLAAAVLAAAFRRPSAFLPGPSPPSLASPCLSRPAGRWCCCLCHLLLGSV